MVWQGRYPAYRKLGFPTPHASQGVRLCGRILVSSRCRSLGTDVRARNSATLHLVRIQCREVARSARSPAALRDRPSLGVRRYGTRLQVPDRRARGLQGLCPKRTTHQRSPAPVSRARSAGQQNLQFPCHVFPRHVASEGYPRGPSLGKASKWTLRRRAPWPRGGARDAEGAPTWVIRVSSASRFSVAETLSHAVRNTRRALAIALHVITPPYAAGRAMAVAGGGGVGLGVVHGSSMVLVILTVNGHHQDTNRVWGPPTGMPNLADRRWSAIPQCREFGDLVRLFAPGSQTHRFSAGQLPTRKDVVADPVAAL